MSTLQRPYSLHQDIPIQQAISAYDVIQQMERSLKAESTLQTEEVNIPQNLIKHSAANMRLNYASLETMRDEILSVERAITQRHSQQAKKLATKQEYQSKQRAELQQQLESLKTHQSSKEKFQESNRAHQEKSSRLQQEIEQLKSQRTNQQSPSATSRMNEATQASVETLNKQQTKITQLQSKIFQLKTMKTRQISRNEVLTHQLTALQETHQSLQAKQQYCIEQTALYTNKMRQKEAQRDETRADYQEIQANVNDLIGAKRSYLERIANEIDQCATAQLDEIRENFRQQLVTNQQRLDESLVNVRSSNARALENLEEKRKSYYEQVKASRQTQLEQVEEILDDYWRYVNDGTFRIFNTKQQEYLYAADYEPFDDDRRRVFTWRPGCPVNQGDWKLEQSSSGTFCILNKKQGEYLYASDYKPFDDDRRQVFTWRPGSRVRQGYWKLKQSSSGTFRIFNTKQREYLYASDYKPFDDDRRQVFTWIPGNPIIQGDWEIIKIA